MQLNFKSILTLCLFLFVHTHFSVAQKKPIKFGKISQEELKSTHYAIDSSASAVILSDVGSSHFKMVKSNGKWKLIFKRHTRIKILSKEGYDYATWKVNFYEANSEGRDMISPIKAVSYNLEDGKVVKTKMGKDAVFEEQVRKNWKSLNFTIPNVKVGTVLEFSYSITSDFISNLQPWKFQYGIPVLHSNYTVTIPEFFEYQFLMTGYEAIAKTVNSKPEVFSFEWRSTPKQGGKIETGISELPSVSNIHTMEGENIPAFIEESYVDSYENYISKISFQLLSTQFPHQPVNRYMGTWDKLNTSMLENPYFGTKIDQAFFLKKKVEEITAGLTSDQDKFLAIFNYVKSNVRWTGGYGIYLSTNLKEPLNDGEGTVAEINLLLVAMLQRTGLAADPALLSTTGHGRLKKEYAISKQFNYVVCLVDIDGKSLLVDATEHFLPIGTLPKRCLNGSGRIISKTRPGWISLETKKKNSLKISGELNISASGDLEGTIKKSYGGYRARGQRVKYWEEGEDDYIENQIANSTFDVSELTVENGTEYSAPFLQKLTLSSAEDAEKMGDMIYLDPMILGTQGENPFKLKERKYPIIYSTKQEVVYYMNIAIPEGFQVDELPKPIAMALPDNAGTYRLQVSVQGDKVNVLSKFNINKKMFVQNEYATLKKFYSQMIAAQSNQIVLKKI